MRVKNTLLSLPAAPIWGTASVAQSVGMDYVGPFTFNCVRCLMGGVVLLPCTWFSNRKNKKRKQVPTIPGAREILVIGGICCGVALCLASNFQQLGIQYTTVGKAGSITARYTAIVPVLGLLLGKKRSPAATGTVTLFLAGPYMLCMNGGELSMNKGDFLVLVCAFLSAVHIMVTDFSSPVVDSVKMSCIQFFASGILLGGAMLVNETPEMSQIMVAWAPAPYAGIMSCGVAYTLQIVGQKGMNPAVASLMPSLKSSISALVRWAISGQRLSSREVLDHAPMLSAIIPAQIPVGRNREASLNTEGDQKARYKKTANGFPVTP